MPAARRWSGERLDDLGQLHYRLADTARRHAIRAFWLDPGGQAGDFVLLQPVSGGG